MRMLKLVLLICALFCASGCSSSSTATVDESLKPALQDFAQFLESIKGDGMKPPKKMSEFIPVEPMAPIAAEFLQNGKLVYIWGSGIDKSGQKVIAYDKDAATLGGYVLLQDGTVKEMTSEEFASAPKAGS